MADLPNTLLRQTPLDSLSEAPTIYDLALRQRNRLAGLAALVEHANDSLAIGYAGGGLCALLRDAADAAGELLERLQKETEAQS